MYFILFLFYIISWHDIYLFIVLFVVLVTVNNPAPQKYQN